MKKNKKIFRAVFVNLIIFLLTMAAMLLSLEAYLRVFKPDLRLTPGTYVSHPTRRYALRPNFSGETYGHRYSINSFGLRDYEYRLLEKDNKTFRILCIGDSCTFGIGLDLEDTYPKQLECLLQNKYPGTKIEVINCGVSSYNTAYEYLFLKEEGLRYRSDLVILQYIYNDSILNYPVTSAKNPFLNKAKDFLRKLYLYEFVVDKIYNLTYSIRGLMGKDPSIRQDYIKNAYSEKYKGWQENKKAFKLLSELSNSSGIPIIYVVYPKFENLEKSYPYEFYHDIIKNALKGEPYVLDLLPYFIGRNTKDLWVNSFDSHPNRYANGLISEAILNLLISSKLIHKERRQGN